MIPIKSPFVARVGIVDKVQEKRPVELSVLCRVGDGSTINSLCREAQPSLVQHQGQVVVSRGMGREQTDRKEIFEVSTPTTE